MNNKQAELLLNNLSTINAKGSVGFKIAYNIRKLNEELKEYLEAKTELFRKYGEEKDGNLVINTMGANYRSYSLDIAPLEDEKCDVKLKHFTEAELENSDLSTRDYLVLMELMENEDENIDDTR